MIRLAALALILLPTAPTAQTDATRIIAGTLSFVQRIALPPNAAIVVEAHGLRNVLLGEARFTAGSAQVPLPFSLTLPAGPSAVIKATIAIDGQTRWLGDAVLLPAGTDDATIDDFHLGYYPSGLVPTPMRCGETPINISLDGEAVIVEVNDQSLRMLAVPAASGAKFELPGDATTYYWSKGNRGLLRILGKDFPECTTIAAPATLPYKARGNEPAWALTVTGDAFDFSRMGTDTVSGTVPAAVWRGGSVVWDLTDAAVTVRMNDRLCHDAMSGMPFPETVKIDTADGPLSGCGGDPVSLLAGGAWIVRDVGRAGIIDTAMVSMVFDADGSVSGTGGCNRYNGGFTLTGERLSFGPAAATRMACAEAVMNLEQTFFQALATVARFDIADPKMLLLYNDKGEPVVRAVKK